MTATLSHGTPQFRAGHRRDLGRPVADVPGAARPRPGAPRRRRRTSPSDDYYVLSRHADICAAARDHETFSSAQGLTVNYGELEMIGLARQSADGDAGSTGAHRVPQAGVARVHAAPGRGRRAEGPRVRRRAHRAATRQRRRRHRRRTVQAAAVDGRRALSRRARGGPRPVRRLDRGHRRRQHRRGRHRRARWKRSATRSAR